ncbi:MAG TPA: hypothetical protein VIM25_12115 [Candidatus Limnocylindrales bacterium]|jgi:hypothetical protein
MFDRMARNGGLGGLAAVTVLVAVLAGCSADASAARLGAGIRSSVAQSRLEGDPYQAGTRAPAAVTRSTTAVSTGVGSAAQLRLEGDPYQAGTRPPAGAKASTAQAARATVQQGLNGTHPGGGGPQE